MVNRQITQMDIIWFGDRLAENEKSKATIDKYARDVRAFAAFAGRDEICKQTTIRYKQYLMEHYAPASVNSILASLNCFLKEMGWHDSMVKSLRIQRQAFRSGNREMTKAEYLRLLEAAEKRGDRRLYLLMQTICATGIRISELRYITVEAVRSGRATVSLKGKTREVLIPSALCPELLSYVKEKSITKGSVFVTRNGNPMDRSNILHSMKKLCELADVEQSKVFPHNFRHLFATIYYQASGDLSCLADLLGHSNINTTRIYTSISCSEHQRKIDELGLVIPKEAPHNVHCEVLYPEDSGKPLCESM